MRPQSAPLSPVGVVLRRPVAETRQLRACATGSSLGQLRATQFSRWPKFLIWVPSEMRHFLLPLSVRLLKKQAPQEAASCLWNAVTHRSLTPLPPV